MIIIAGSIYALTADWGPLDNSFILPACIGAILAGVFVLLTSTLGIIGVMFQQQAEKFEDEALQQDVKTKYNENIANVRPHIPPRFPAIISPLPNYMMRALSS